MLRLIPKSYATMWYGAVGVAPRVALARRDARREIEAFHRRTRIERGERFARRLVAGADDAAHHADAFSGGA